MVTKVNAAEIKVDFPEIKNDRMRNFRERIWYIKYWVEFMKRNPDEIWSKGQKDLIDSQFQKADEFYADLGKTEEGREILERLKEEKLKKER
jgi:hypothetical protein